MKKDDDDFPLLKFDFRPPPCKVIVFPMSARVGKARHVAEKLLDRSAEQQEAYWNLTMKNMRDVLSRLGLSDEQIEAEQLAFREVVRHEMDKAHAISSQSARPAEWDDGPRRA